MANKLGTEILRWNKLRAELENVEDMDVQCLLDCLEGETELIPILFDIDAEIFERENFVVALKNQIETLEIRKSRHEKCVEKMRTIILNVMDNAGLEKIKGTLSTISITKTKPKLEILEESEIPAKFWEAQDPKLNKHALLQALENKEEVQGATISENGISLAIRRR